MKKITVKECAELLGLTKQAVIHRIGLGRIDAEKNSEGQWEVVLNDKISPKFAPIDQNNPEKLAQRSELALKKIEDLSAKVGEQNIIIQGLNKEMFDLKQIIKHENPSLEPSQTTRNPRFFSQAFFIILAAMILSIAGIEYLHQARFSEFMTTSLIQNSENQKVISKSTGTSDATPMESASNIKPGSEEMRKSLVRAVDFLKSQRNGENWSSHPGITALCVLGILESPIPENEKRELTGHSLGYLSGLQAEDGSISGNEKSTANYSTAFALMAMSASGDKAFGKAKEKARAYLEKIQTDEGEGCAKDGISYGGMGYNGNGRPDLNNLQVAMEALSAAGAESGDPAVKKALVFVNRCQATEENDLMPNVQDGSFAYGPALLSYANDAGAESLKSGSLAISGLKCLLLCKPGQDDPRVKLALSWLERNFSLDENPGTGRAGLYFYYFNLSRTLRLMNLRELHGSGGDSVKWPEELAIRLLRKQRGDGSWVNTNAKYMENNPVLATAYALCAMGAAYKEIL